MTMTTTNEKKKRHNTRSGRLTSFSGQSSSSQKRNYINADVEATRDFDPEKEPDLGGMVCGCFLFMRD
jgi:hypothetical protein